MVDLLLFLLFHVTFKGFVIFRSINKAADDNAERFSEVAVNTIKNDFYVDDLVKSVKSVEEARSLSKELTELLKRAGFRLTKWMSSH